MQYFANISDGLVVRVMILNDEDCYDGILPQADIAGAEFIASIDIAGVWILTSKSGEYRYNYAGVGDTYDIERDAFIGQKPFPSWALDENVMRWFAPVPMPSEGGPWTWDEATLSWIGTAYPVVFMKPR